MKTFTSAVLLLAAVFALTDCLPPAPREHTDLMFVPLESSETEYSEELEPHSYTPFGFSFPGFFNDFDAMIRRFAESLKHFAIGTPQNLGEITNATSTQEVVDGHVVTINDTTYTKKGNNSDAVFVVRVIDVKPTEVISTVPVEEPVSSEESIEKIQSEDSNEIPKGQVGSKNT